MKQNVIISCLIFMSVSCAVETSDSTRIAIEAETIAKAEKVVESIELPVIQFHGSRFFWMK